MKKKYGIQKKHGIRFYFFFSIYYGSKIRIRVVKKKEKMFFKRNFFFNLSSSSATTGRLDVGLKTKKNFEIRFYYRFGQIFFFFAKKNKNSVVQKKMSRFVVTYCIFFSCDRFSINIFFFFGILCYIRVLHTVGTGMVKMTCNKCDVVQSFIFNVRVRNIEKHQYQKDTLDLGRLISNEEFEEREREKNRSFGKCLIIPGDYKYQFVMKL